MYIPDEGNVQGNSDWLETYGLLLEDKVPCEADDCENDATHYFQMNCCGEVVIACETDVNKMVAVLMHLHRRNKKVVCDKCGKPNNPAGWINRPEEL